MEKRKTKKIKIGNISIGGDSPIAVQSMLKTDPENIQKTLIQATELKKVGCELIRMALPYEDSCKIIPFFKKEIGVPLIGDIHFNHKIALKAMESGIDAIRINPGTINNVRKVKEIGNIARETKTPLRIGFNVGSVEKKILKKYGKPNADAMVESALYYVKLFEDIGWTELKVSLKASDIFQTVEAYKKFSDRSDYPLHIGITEAGPVFSGVIKSSIGIGILLYEGIGDTIRVSLTGNPVLEVVAAYHILRSMGLRKRGINIISCPTCGRCKTNLMEIVEDFEKETGHFEGHLNVAIMGCEVNGPGEAKEADIGIAFGANKAVLFSKGVVIRNNIPKEIAKDLLKEEIYNISTT
ncbi:MAG TPA: flavodoxin-dependent (E)-4-hydroxy-3-methylbut-2-enyl-diphosphate synthase [Syntrophorhabdaceae bacterium]|jgi:(E)-4-hydroxy-3-methylbut-2-enyl-diphosphate synthase|nr:flavodoxin-dependent (E)-4-hydroxy-3-methylbut-2-enyl-diphosphate synthase [Syntrophorhabdaceae bacterium]MDI9559916.1 flavodoxin-dependent (E)-4-hydroxy-3-methylbut-2-enyl-diphosphate synthase [Pseudomonadota bacterium]OQC50933.1 MAG: 4-hydroxy-3-methylbut-2-en-1-yl diphosphate synthase [Deltaproteobacteria bacterium ADurb.Bin026]MBV6504574.1 4-hydroxy-3-methylbut-2-en-1-yl diphosphate synthase (flavodoxin) [Syntrophorhabdaceae bacterium]HNZ58427.1 flavodoxin-dependent (E)-4-hydroxy-3-methy